HVQWLVILDETDGGLEVVTVGSGIDALPTRGETKLVGRARRLRRILATTEIETERPDAIGVATELCARVPGEDQRRRAVDAARDRDGNRLARRAHSGTGLQH